MPRLGTLILISGLAWFAADAAVAQTNICIRLEAELARIDQPQGAAPLQVRGLEDAIGKQRNELDRAMAMSQRYGCERRGFILFNFQERHPQCPQIDAQVARARQGLDRMMGDLQRARGGSPADGDAMRRQILTGLAQNNCGPQYRMAVPQQPQRPNNFFESLFGRSAYPDEGEFVDVPKVSTYRTLCVRACDGFYFPISFSATPSKFREDESICRAQCPATEVALYAHRNPGEEVSQAVSIAGKVYADMPNAFKYRQAYNAACSCRLPGQSWAEALGELDNTLRRGDIVVTEEQSKAMQQQAIGGAPTQAPKASGNSRTGTRRTTRGANADAGQVPPPEPAPLSPELRPTSPPSASTTTRRPARAVGPASGLDR